MTVCEVPLAVPMELGREYQDLLSAEEFVRLKVLRDHVMQSRYAVCHGVLRLLLANYMNTSARKVLIDQDIFGKPYLGSPRNQDGPFFNLSHSGDLAVVAIARTQVGVDIEQTSRRIDLCAFARALTREEVRRLEFADAEARSTLAYHYWTAKEAYLKLLGVGLRSSVESLAALGLFDGAYTLEGEKLGAHACRLFLPKGHVGHLATYEQQCAYAHSKWDHISKVPGCLQMRDQTSVSRMER